MTLNEPVKGVSPAALEVLLCHDFPENIRELKNLVERAVLLIDENESILPEHPLGTAGREGQFRINYRFRSGVRFEPARIRESIRRKVHCRDA